MHFALKLVIGFSALHIHVSILNSRKQKGNLFAAGLNDSMIGVELKMLAFQVSGIGSLHQCIVVLIFFCIVRLAPST